MKKLSTIATITTLAALCLLGQTGPAMAAEPGTHPPPAVAPDEGDKHGDTVQDLMHRWHGMRQQLKGKHLGYSELVLKHTKDLALSDEQIGKITRIQQDQQSKAEEMARKVHQSLKATHDAFLKPAADEAAIRKSAQDHIAAFNALVDMALQARNGINAVLTPEQLQKLKAFKDDH